jgi:TPR repeat protein
VADRFVYGFHAKKRKMSVAHQAVAKDIDIQKSLVAAGKYEFDLSLVYADGRGVTKNSYKELIWLKRSWKKRFPAAAAYLAFHYEEKGMKQTAETYYRLALSKFLGSMLLNDSYGESERWVSMFYLHGWGVSRDPEKAMHLLRTAADRGCKLAMSEVQTFSKKND